MIGRTEIILNQHAITQALQEYLDKRLVEEHGQIVRSAMTWTMDDGNMGMKVVVESLKTFVTGKP